MKASWNGETLAESDDTVVVEGNHYFPVSSLRMEFFRKNDHSTHCPWKGDASYYDVIVDGETNESAAWYYAEPFEKAAMVTDRVAFWKGVEVGE